MRNEWPGPAEKTCSGTHSSSDHSNEATKRAQPLAAQTNGETKIREMMSYTAVSVSSTGQWCPPVSRA
ncbi:hypothetical protein CSOJ01_11362 [Colletotrichum sojae]|uniref:Uncharacterized protein n=1 Tax=Colletotrichum sojae TaxID=2175907 RepID=A0A8H6MNX0_9PEZI|nr:hypothetical protein CSOJ01_11362 [Colletotrichum sojae]